MSPQHKPVVWLHGEVKSPPFSQIARLEVGFLLRCIQAGDTLSMPHARPMPTIGSHCYELRVQDLDVTWRIIYRIDKDAIVIADIFDKKTNQTPKHIIDVCKKRLQHYDSIG